MTYRGPNPFSHDPNHEATYADEEPVQPQRDMGKKIGIRESNPNPDDYPEAG